MTDTREKAEALAKELMLAHVQIVHDGSANPYGRRPKWREGALPLIQAALTEAEERGRQQALAEAAGEIRRVNDWLGADELAKRIEKLAQKG